ncbi:hypothetical protein ACQPZF_10385 [Actinosynnema sp. CS-041913]|uniref:hypothetical protein n=1 Tax=Actinosynnema sp. CS-041913 TaxID=3239917 RepID=UPI003D8C0108
MNAVFGKPLARAIGAALVTSGLGITINVATDLKGNLLSWLAVAALTVTSGFLVATTTNGGGGRVGTRFRETVLTFTNPDSKSKARPGGRYTQEVKGIVMRKEIETHSDGTRIERIDYFSVELALRDIASKPPSSREELNEP